MAATFDWQQDTGAATGSPAKGTTRTAARTACPAKKSSAPAPAKNAADYAYLKGQLKTEQERAQIAAALQIIQAQTDINKAEATNPSIFVAGWRPFIGWVCGAACAWNWIGLPVMKAALVIAGYSFDLKPADVTGARVARE